MLGAGAAEQVGALPAGGAAHDGPPDQRGAPRARGMASRRRARNRFARRRRTGARRRSWCPIGSSAGLRGRGCTMAPLRSTSAAPSASSSSALVGRSRSFACRTSRDESARRLSVSETVETPPSAGWTPHARLSASAQTVKRRRRMRQDRRRPCASTRVRPLYAGRAVPIGGIRAPRAPCPHGGRPHRARPEQRFRALLEGVPVCSYRWEAGSAGRCLYVSPQIEEQDTN